MVCDLRIKGIEQRPQKHEDDKEILLVKLQKHMFLLKRNEKKEEIIFLL